MHGPPQCMQFPGRGACRHAINRRLFTPTPARTTRVAPARRSNDAPRRSVHVRAAGIRRLRAIFLTCTSKLYWNPVLILNPTDCIPIRHHPTSVHASGVHAIICAPRPGNRIVVAPRRQRRAHRPARRVERERRRRQLEARRSLLHLTSVRTLAEAGLTSPSRSLEIIIKST